MVCLPRELHCHRRIVLPMFVISSVLLFSFLTRPNHYLPLQTLNTNMQTIIRRSFNTYGYHQSSGYTIANEKNKIPNSDVVFFVLADHRVQVQYNSHIDAYRCYTKLNNFNLILHDMTNVPECDIVTDFFFKRHCILYHTMMNTTYKWFVFSDADVVILNNYDIRDYIKPEKDLMHYRRVFFNEVAAGGYIVKNSEWGRSYVRSFYELHPNNPDVSKRFTGGFTDNGALMWLLHRMMSMGDDECVVKSEYEFLKPGAFERYMEYIGCLLLLFEANCDREMWTHVYIYPPAESWVYDGSATGFKWSNATFMHHGVKNLTLIKGYDFPHFPCDGNMSPPLTDKYYTDESKIQAMIANVISHRHEKLGWNATSCG